MQPHRTGARPGEAGFTLLELIIVVAMIGILAAIVLPNLKDHPTRAKEAVLKQNLRTMRDVLDQHYADKGAYPMSLEALVEEGYLRSMPYDPIAKSTDSWVPVFEEFDEEAAETDYGEEGGPGIVDVHSSAEIPTLDGSALYSEW